MDKAWRVRKSYVEEVTFELSLCGCVGFELKKKKIWVRETKQECV